MQQDQKWDIQKLSDEALVLELKKQFTPHLFEELVGRHQKDILNKCSAYVQDRDTAKDLCQDVLIKVYLQLHTYRSDARFSTWLHSIMHNLCMDYLRRNKKNMHLEVTEKLAEEIGEILDYDKEAISIPTEDLLEQLLELIPGEDKLLLMMKYKEKHSLHEIQEMLNIGESALKMRLKRAKEKIRVLYRTNPGSAEHD